MVVPAEVKEEEPAADKNHQKSDEPEEQPEEQPEVVEEEEKSVREEETTVYVEQIKEEEKAPIRVNPTFETTKFKTPKEVKSQKVIPPPKLAPEKKPV